MRHPAEYFIKYMIIRDPAATDANLMKQIEDWGFLTPAQEYLGYLRQRVLPLPPGFDPGNRLHRPTMQYLRDQEVYELFWPTDAMEGAWQILNDPEKRLFIEQALLARIDPKISASRANKAKSWYLTAEGIKAYGHYFWNVKLLTFDEWGRFMFGRSALYERYLSMLTADHRLAYFQLRFDQVVESKDMLHRAQQIAFFTLEEVNNKPGAGPDKVKAIGILTKALVDCHEALSTSDMALKDVLKQFEQFRMTHPATPAVDIQQLAPGGNYSGSGVKQLAEGEKDKVH